jgi:F0F1-type ATP synthase assembly protein I
MAPDGSRSRSPLGLLAVGTTLVSCIVLGCLLGAYLDRRWTTGPWLTLVGTLLGAGAGFLELFRTVSRDLK